LGFDDASLSIPINSSEITKVIAPNASCPGTPGEPKAASGAFCVYKVEQEEAALSPSIQQFGKSGFLLQAGGEPGGFAFGTWAVKAP
jgi:hypothetical protein